MKRHPAVMRAVFPALILAAGLLAAGCGEKIAIPQPSGIFSINRYVPLDTFVTEEPALQVTQARGLLFVLTEGVLSKRDTKFDLIGQVAGLADPRALCADSQGRFIFVWEQGFKQVSWYDPGSLELMGSSMLPEVSTVTAMATNPAGIGQVDGATTFLYLSDPEAGRIHRYAFSAGGGLQPHGILASSDGAGARFVHEPAGMATDGEGRMLVCDADSSRNWVIRFDSTPDVTDAAGPLRGLAILFDVATCEPAAAADYVLGNAAACQETGWRGGPSDASGEFTVPSQVAVDGSGRIFVADTGNRRLQMFSPLGEHELQFVCSDISTGPTSLAVFDEASKEVNVLDYGAFVFVTLADRDMVIKFISVEHYQSLFSDLPPEP